MGRNLRGRKPKQELGEKDGETTVGREGLRVREHNTRKLIAAVIFFPPTLKGVGSGFVRERDLVWESQKKLGFDEIYTFSSTGMHSHHLLKLV